MERGWTAGWAGLGEAKESTERKGPQAPMQPEEAGHRPERLTSIVLMTEVGTLCKDQYEMTVFKMATRWGCFPRTAK